MAGLLAGDIDAAEAMTYNEYAQVLEAVNPDTGELYTADDLNVVSYEEEGVGMLQDAIWADEDTPRRSRVLRPGDRLREGVDQGLGVLPRQRRGVPRHRGGQGLDARRNAPAVADERDQQAHLAGRGRCRRHRHRRVGADGRHRQRDHEPRRRDRADSGPRRHGWTNDIVNEAIAQLTADGVDVNGSSFAPIEVRADRGRRMI